MSDKTQPKKTVDDLQNENDILKFKMLALKIYIRRELRGLKDDVKKGKNIIESIEKIETYKSLLNIDD